MKQTIINSLLILLILDLIYLLPIILDPMLFLNRGNDLEIFFWPIYNYIKQNIYSNYQLPLWNNLYFSGTPLLPNPQSALFYIPNIIFLFFPIDLGFILSLIIHMFLGSISAFFLAKQLGYTNKASIFTALLYSFSPKFAGFIESGHFGLIISYGWIPVVLLSFLKSLKAPSLFWPTLTAIGLTAIYFAHLITFSILALCLTIATICLIYKFNFKTVFRLILIPLLTFGLTAIVLLPQIEWKDQTTRFLLIEQRDIYPKWQSFGEFFNSIVWSPKQNFEKADTEKWLFLGNLAMLLSFISFLFLDRSKKVFILLVSIMVVVISLNNLLPLLTNHDWYALMRVSTRVWLIEVIVVSFLAGYALDKLKISNYLLLPLCLLTLAELLILSWIRIKLPINQASNQLITTSFNSSSTPYRVFCLDRCIPQKTASIQGLELVEGYDTVAQRNYYKQMWQFTNSFWNYYTLSLPPIGLYTFEKINPNFKSLGAYNVKYVLSPHPLNEGLLQAETKGYFIYFNNYFQERAYYLDNKLNPKSGPVLTKYTPNFIQIELPDKEPRLVLAQVYNPGWKAYINGKIEVPIQEKPNGLMQVDLPSNASYIDFYYLPFSFKIGTAITLLTLLYLIYLHRCYLK